MAQTVSDPVQEALAAAWLAYRDVLRDLRGPEYEQAEPLAWAALQEQLAHTLELEDAVDGVHFA